IADLDRQIKAVAVGAPAIPSDLRRMILAGLVRSSPPVQAIWSLPDAYLLAVVRQRGPLQKKLDEARKSLTTLNNAIVKTMVREERMPPRQAPILIRGQYDKHGDKVDPAVVASLAPLPAGLPNSRLGLARWLVDPANPLTARVTVNRYWQMFF